MKQKVIDTDFTEIDKVAAGEARRMNYQYTCSTCGHTFVGFVNQITCLDCIATTVRHKELDNVIYTKRLFRRYKGELI